MMKQGLNVMDCELHLEEPWDLWERSLPEPYRSRTRVVAPKEGHLTPGGHRIQFDGKDRRELQGVSLIQRQAQRKWQTDPHLVEARTHCTPQVYDQGLDIEGIDLAVLSPTTTMSVVRYDDLDPQHALAICRAYNDWAYSFTQGNPRRYKFWGFLPPQDAALAAQEARRCVRELGAVGVATLQGAINGHLFSDEFFDPLWEELNELDVPLGIHV